MIVFLFLLSAEDVFRSLFCHILPQDSSTINRNRLQILKNHGYLSAVHAQPHENRRETGRNEERIRSMLQVRRISGWKTGNGERKREEATGIEIDCGLWPSLDELWMMREAAVSTKNKKESPMRDEPAGEIHIRKSRFSIQIRLRHRAMRLTAGMLPSTTSTVHTSRNAVIG